MNACRSPIAAAALAAVAASVQAAPEPTRRDPANPQADVPAVSYRSPFTDYRRFGDQPVADWRALNDQVRAIGGWRAYAREANAPEAGDQAPAAPPKDASPARPAAPASRGAHEGNSGTSKER